MKSKIEFFFHFIRLSRDKTQTKLSFLTSENTETVVFFFSAILEPSVRELDIATLNISIAPDFPNTEHTTHNTQPRNSKIELIID